MKLLTTIAAVLISISAFSQDLIEYDNGTFTHNGEELSMQQIDDLTVLHKAGRGNVRRANRFISFHRIKTIVLRITLEAWWRVVLQVFLAYLPLFWVEAPYLIGLRNRD